MHLLLAYCLLPITITIGYWPLLSLLPIAYYRLPLLLIALLPIALIAYCPYYLAI